MENGKTSLNIRKLKKQVKGITLIALVVTIIVLLILAGVAISLTIGQNGIFARAQNAVNVYEQAATNEQSELGKAEDIMDEYLNGNGGNQGGGGEYNTGTTVEEARNQNKPFENDTTITDSCTPANSIRVPAGFKIAEDSALTVEDGVVIEDKDGNQFVWIPAKTEAEGGAIINLSSGGTANVVYKRTDFGKQYGSYSNYSETMPSDEEASVNAWGGYYIGRFEAGDKESTEAKTMRSGETDATITIKKGQAPYNYITQANAKTKAEGMDTLQEYTTATTKLVSSYAWDTAINFIQIKNSDYGTNSPEGNYKNTSFDYTDITGASQTKNNNSSTLIPTGQTTAVSNIYDMGGNLYEYTTESASYEFTPYVIRGGDCSSDYGNSPAGYRSNRNGNAYSSSGFRVTLYCSTEN